MLQIKGCRMELKEFSHQLAKRNAISPTSELENAIVVVLRNYKMLAKSKSADSTITYYKLAKNTHVTGEDGNYIFTKPATKDKPEVNLNLKTTMAGFTVNTIEPQLQPTK